MRILYPCERCGIFMDTDDSDDQYDSLMVAEKHGAKYTLHILCPQCRKELNDWYFIRGVQVGEK